MYIQAKRQEGCTMEEIINQIHNLKKQRNAIILAHNYQRSEIQEVADIVGDSYALSKAAKEAEHDVIVFCGVHFMAETAKLLSPQKTVLLPAADAGCPMADMVTPADVKTLKAKYPDAAVVCYVNTSAAVKAESDVCCTSSNAVDVIKALPQHNIIFIPDAHLGDYVAKQVPEKNIILFDGYCITHKRVTLKEVEAARKVLPEAKMLVHPECLPEVVAKADFVGSTAQIIAFAQKHLDDKFIIGTEQGVLHWLQKHNQHKKFYLLSPKLICPNMKKTTLQDVKNALQNNTCEITLNENVMKKARVSIEKMLMVHA